jgi:hypothetical protein
MPLSKDILGTALYTVRQKYCNKTYEQIIAEFGSIEAMRLAEAKDEADEIIKHIKTSGLVVGVQPGAGTATIQ